MQTGCTSGGIRWRLPPRRRKQNADASWRVHAAVARFMVGRLAAIVVVVVGGAFALRNLLTSEAIADTRELARFESRLVEVAGLSEGITRSDPAAIRRLDELVTGRVLGGSIVRVKLWTEDGTILYSDEPALIGERYPLEDEERALFGTGNTSAELSDLDDPENRYERGEGKLLEAYTPIRAPDGTPLLFEIYQRFSVVSATGTRLLRLLAPPLIGGVVVLLLFQVPLAWTMARRLQRGSREREALLANAIEASAQERRRIASALHDGVVQDLAGVAFGLAPLATSARRRGDDAEEAVLREATGALQQSVRDLRTLLVEIHPPNLEVAGLRAALSDLLSPLKVSGIATSLEVDEVEYREPDGAGYSPEVGRSRLSTDDALVYRAACEAIRNAQMHARPSTVSVSVTREPHRTRLVVSDDGVGFAPDARRQRGTEGHMGLTLLEGIVAQAGGTLEVRSAPGAGTTVTLELPAR